MNSDFAKNITLQRKERHISQKQAAADLGISQALLSHYEKGIRECGLDFLVKIADYYNVSCDFLLGRNDVQEYDADNVQEISGRMIADSVSRIIDDSCRSGGKKLSAAVSSYLMMIVYKLVRMLHGENGKFKIPGSSAKCCADAAALLYEADISDALKNEPDVSGGISLPENLVKQSEEIIKRLR